MRVLVALALAPVLAGCGVYSIRLDPPPDRVAAGRPSRPLDLTVSLGEVRTYVDGRRVGVDESTIAAIDADFVRAANASGLFRSAVLRSIPRSSRSDLYVDARRELHAAPITPARSAYLMLAGPLTFLAPGFPYPWDYRVTRTVKLRGEVDGASIPLPEREVTYDERVWGANYWGGLSADPLREAEGEYLVAAVAKVIEADYPLFEHFAAAARAGDVEAAWLLSEQASSR